MHAYICSDKPKPLVIAYSAFFFCHCLCLLSGRNVWPTPDVALMSWDICAALSCHVCSFRATQPPPRTHELPPHNHAEFLATISQWNHFCRQSGAAVLFSLTAKNIRESNFPSTQPSHQRCFMKTNTYHSSIMCHFNDQQFCRNLYVWKKI